MKKIFFILLVAFSFGCNKAENENTTDAATSKEQITNQTSVGANDRSVTIVNSITISEVDYLNTCSLNVTVRNYYTNALVYSGAISAFLPYTFTFVTTTDAEYKVNLGVTPWYPNFNGKKFNWTLRKSVQGQPVCQQGPSNPIATIWNGPIFDTGDSWEACF